LNPFVHRGILVCDNHSITKKFLTVKPGIMKISVSFLEAYVILVRLGLQVFGQCIYKFYPRRFTLLSRWFIF